VSSQEIESKNAGEPLAGRRLLKAGAGPARVLLPVDTPAHALQLLGSIWLGRIVFTVGALPTIRPVDHVVADGCVIVRTDVDTALACTLRRSGSEGMIVAYEADDIDLSAHDGWSVIVTGRAELVTDPAEQRRYRAILHSPVESPMDLAVRIRPVIVTGYELHAPPDFGVTGLSAL
jgi:pyridoxamine 5'-phosphate oxidase-like protein